MQIDFTKLQQLFIDKINSAENLLLKTQDVSFQIHPNYKLEAYNTAIKIQIFEEEFSVGYLKTGMTEEALITDFFSRLHDYNTDNIKSHIIGLKILELEKKFSKIIHSLREKILRDAPNITSKEIFIGISDSTPNQSDERGFPKFEMYVLIKGEQIMATEIDFYRINYKLEEEIGYSITQKM